MKRALAIVTLSCALVVGGAWIHTRRTVSSRATEGLAPGSVDLAARAGTRLPPSGAVRMAQGRVLAPETKREPGAGGGGDGGAQPQGSLIEFVVDAEGLAIAYGDLLLGAPKEGSGILRGHYDAPGPQQWEKPEIAYQLHSNLAHPERVEQAIAYFNEHTPVRWVPRRDEPDAIVFEQGAEHCYSYLGKIGGLQPIRLSEGCQAPEILHEMMHALGFVHEQSRTDRGPHLEVLWDAIDKKFHAQFALVPEAFMEVSRLAPFDFQSAMLYRPEVFALQPGRPTMRAKGQVALAPVREGLSAADIARLRRLYRLD